MRNILYNFVASALRLYLRISRNFMSIKSLTLKGLRGFSSEQSLRFAKSSGELGSGLTILVGPNSGGKSTVVEALRVFSKKRNVSFSEGKRNKEAGDRILIRIEFDAGNKIELKTVESGGSQTEFEPEISQLGYRPYVLPSRRYFRTHFGNSMGVGRQEYIELLESETRDRGDRLDTFTFRLFNALKNQKEFNQVLQKVMDPVPDWTIDQSDEGNYYLKINASGQYHTSDGLGEGIVSLFFIIDALYDSEAGDFIVIDEPELSLHPAYQRRLAKLFAEYSKSRQIVYATHSPYFVDFQYLSNGAEIARVHKGNGGCTISQLSPETGNSLRGLLENRNNPHILGLNAREALFLEDRVILVEGQEDVVYYTRLVKNIAPKLENRFFGWGVGGAGNIETISSLLHDLGFNKVAVIVDKNKKNLLPDLKQKFKEYHFDSIPAEDVRTKEEKTSKETYGLFDKNDFLRSEFEEETEDLFRKTEEFLQSNNPK